MGNITVLKQGSLNGLRRQTNECLVSAYNKGYEDGKKESTEEYGELEYAKGYNTAIEDYNKLIEYLYENRLYKFLNEYYAVENYTGGIHLLKDLVKDYDITELLSNFKEWQVKINQTKEEIKVGDIVRYATDTEKMIVTRVTNEKIETLDKNGCVESWKKSAALHKWGNENVAAKLQALFEGAKESLDE